MREVQKVLKTTNGGEKMMSVSSALFWLASASAVLGLVVEVAGASRLAEKMLYSGVILLCAAFFVGILAASGGR